MEELKPCPFCGGEATLDHYESDGYLAYCILCHAMIEHWCADKQEAINKWNKRVGDECWIAELLKRQSTI